MFLLSRAATPGTILLSLALLGYSIARASLVSYNNDEALTFLYHARSSVVDIINYNSRIMPSNNHMLNSLLMKASSALLGESELALRLPNVLAHAVYLTTCFFLVRAYAPAILRPFALILLGLNPYFLEFFSLSRGYGLAVAAMICSLFFALRAADSRRGLARDLWLAAGFAGVTVLASIPFVNFFVAMFAVLGTIVLWRSRPSISAPVNWLAWVGRAVQAAVPLMVTGIAVLAIMLPPILKLRQLNHFYIGGKISFWADTVGSLIDGSLYNAPYEDAAMPIVQVFVAVMLLLSVGLLIVRLVRRQFDAHLTMSAIVLALALLMAASSILQHQLLGVNYLKGRIGIMFVPIFSLLVLNFCLSLGALLIGTRFRQLGPFTIVALAVLLGTHAANTLNTSYSAVLRGNASTRQMIDDLTTHYESNYGQDPGAKVTVGVSAIFKPVVEYYAIARQLEWLKLEEFNTLREDYDYYYYDTDDGRVLNKKNLIRLDVYPQTGGVLATKVPD
jgi:hypothetical protein